MSSVIYPSSPPVGRALARLKKNEKLFVQNADPTPGVRCPICGGAVYQEVDWGVKASEFTVLDSCLEHGPVTDHQPWRGRGAWLR